MFPLGAILDIGSKILDKVFPDPAAAEAAKLKLLEMKALLQNGLALKLMRLLVVELKLNGFLLIQTMVTVELSW